MLSTLLVIVGVVVGLLVLLALIVGLSARPTTTRGTGSAPQAPAWVRHTGQEHPDAWSPPSDTSTNVRTDR